MLPRLIRPARVRRALLACVLALVPIVAGCGTDDAPTGPILSRPAFIDVIVALRQAADTLPTIEAYNAERARILAEAGVTDSALIAFVRVHGADPARMAVIWDTIASRLQHARDEAATDDPR